MLAHRPDEAVGYGERAVALAREVGDAAITSHALTNIGTARWFLGDPAGQRTMEEALPVALDAGDTEDACRAYVNITWTLLDWFRLDEAEGYLAAAMKLAEEHEFLGFLCYMHVARARLALARGEWDDAARHAELGVDAHAPTRCAALTVLGRIRVRRGEPGAAELLGPAWEIAVQVNEMQRMGPVAAARAEDAWLRGDLAAVRDIVTPVYAEAERLNDVSHPPGTRLLAGRGGAARCRGGPGGRWLRGGPGDTGAGAGPDPAGGAAGGAWRAASIPTRCRRPAGGRTPRRPGRRPAAGTSRPPRSRTAGRPADLLTALGILDDLGARPLATRVRGQLKALGVTHIPRGPLGGTRANPAGLTARQIDVLRLLAMGHSNAQIARQLVLSVRTVDSHVAALLGKLGAQDRHDAAARAAELGVLTGSGD